MRSLLEEGLADIQRRYEELKTKFYIKLEFVASSVGSDLPPALAPVAPTSPFLAVSACPAFPIPNSHPPTVSLSSH